MFPPLAIGLHELLRDQLRKDQVVEIRSAFFFNDTATTEIYTLSLHDGSSDLRAPAPRRGTGERTPRSPRRDPSARVSFRTSEEHTSELQSPWNLVCRLLPKKKNYITIYSQSLILMTT